MDIGMYIIQRYRDVFLIWEPMLEKSDFRELNRLSNFAI